MKKQSIYISIPQPCHEKWDSMDATERGAFCHSCSKEVIDFTTMTDREVIDYLSKHKSSCGKFRNDQVDTRLTIARIDNGIFKWKALALGILPFLSFRVFASSSKLMADQSALPKIEKRDTTIKTRIDSTKSELTNKDTSRLEQQICGEEALTSDNSFKVVGDTVLPDVIISAQRNPIVSGISGMMVVEVTLGQYGQSDYKNKPYVKIEYASRKETRKAWFRRFLRID